LRNQLRELTGAGLQKQFDRLGRGVRLRGVAARIRGMSRREGRIQRGIEPTRPRTGKIRQLPLKQHHPQHVVFDMAQPHICTGLAVAVDQCNEQVRQLLHCVLATNISAVLAPLIPREGWPDPALSTGGDDI